MYDVLYKFDRFLAGLLSDHHLLAAETTNLPANSQQQEAALTYNPIGVCHHKQNLAKQFLPMADLLLRLVATCRRDCFQN